MISHYVPSIIEVDKPYQPTVDLRGLAGADVSGFSGYTVVTKIRRAENLIGGTVIRLSIHAPNSSDGALSAIYFGEVATSGNAYDFAASPTQVTFGGKTSLTLSARQVFVSDPITADFNPAKAHILAMNVSSSALRRFTAPEGTRGIVSFYLSAISEAATAAKTAGYTAQANTSYGLTLIRTAGILDQ